MSSPFDALVEVAALAAYAKSQGLRVKDLDVVDRQNAQSWRPTGRAILTAVFTAPEFFGRFYVLNQTKFYIDKIANLITWQSWEDIGMGFGNVASVVKLELYAGSVTPGATDTGFEAALPKEEDDLAPTNNRADAGTTFPKIDQF